MPKRLTFIILTVITVAGCVPLNKDIPSVSQEARIWINQAPSIEVKEAYSGEGEIYVKFLVFSKDSEGYKEFNAHTSWNATAKPTVDFTQDLVIPLEIIDQEKWQERPPQLFGVVPLAEDHWRRFRYALAHELTSTEPLTATVIRTQEDELVLYYSIGKCKRPMLLENSIPMQQRRYDERSEEFSCDSEDHLQVIDVKDKPAEVRIERTLTQSELSSKIVEVMKGYLIQERIDAARILLTVDNEDDYTTPFFYIDTQQKIALNLKLPAAESDKYREGLFKKGFKSADYLLFDSYVLGLVKRPVSSSLRLFSWGQSLSSDMIKPPTLSIFENTSPPPIYTGEPMDLAAFEEKLGKSVSGNTSLGTMDLLIDGDRFFIYLIDAIIAAKKSIDVRIFIFDNDDYALSIANLLKRRSNEGIKVRVLLDGMGQVMGEAKMPEMLPPGYVPPSSMEKYLRADSKIEVRVRPNAWFKADHTKTIIIDNERFFTGGMNIGREYRFHWHDLMMEVRGSIVDEIGKEFEIAWAHAGPWGDLGYLKTVVNKSSFRNEQEGFPVRTLYTRLNDPQIYKAQLLAIKEAKKYIYISNSYFSDDTIIYELIKARHRGVDVRVIMPFSGNHQIMNANNVVSANTMFRNGIRVFFYPQMSHVKAAIYDGWLCTGSANFDKLSLVDNLELNLATTDPAMVERFLKELFEVDFQKSLEMKEPINAGWKERFAEFITEHL